MQQQQQGVQQQMTNEWQLCLCMGVTSAGWVAGVGGALGTARTLRGLYGRLFVCSYIHFVHTYLMISARMHYANVLMASVFQVSGVLSCFAVAVSPVAAVCRS